MAGAGMRHLAWSGIAVAAGGVYARRGPILVIAGFFAIPILSAALPDVWGPILGNAVLGSGWIVLGYELFVSEESGDAS